MAINGSRICPPARPVVADPGAKIPTLFNGGRGFKSKTILPETKKADRKNIKAVAGKVRAAESMVRINAPIPSDRPGKALIKNAKGEKIVERMRVTYLVIKAKKILIPTPKMVKAKIRGIKLEKKFPPPAPNKFLRLLPIPLVKKSPNWVKTSNPNHGEGRLPTVCPGNNRAEMMSMFLTTSE